MKNLIWGCIISILFLTNNVYSKTIIVPTHQTTIQSAIDSSANGDTVLVLDGVYMGDGNRNIDFHGKLIVVKSQNGARNTIIDCEGSDSLKHIGFLFKDGESLLTELKGFTIQNGFGTSSGGAMIISRSNPTISKCIFINNYASAMGGAISIYRGGGMLSNCIFINNVASMDEAVIASFNSSLTIQDCTFFGSGRNQIGSEVGSNLFLTHNLILNGGVVAWNGDDFLNFPPGYVTIQDNIFYNGGASGVIDGVVTGSSINLDPRICDSVNFLYSLEPSSPCLPENNQFGVLIGATDSVCVPTDVEDNNEFLPSRNSLSQNYPNPFNPSTTIKYELTKHSHVKIIVQNVLGETIAVLVNDYKNAGIHNVDWNGKDNQGNSFSTGIYFYEIETDLFTESKKMLLLK